MEIKARTDKGVVILDIGGRIDSDSANLVEVVGTCLRDGYYDILLNFEEVEFIDYLGVSALALAYKEVLNNKGRMKFLNVPMHVRQILSVAGLDKVIDIHTQEEVAIKSFKQDRVIENIKRMQMRRRFKRLPLDIQIDLLSKHSRTPHCLKVELLDLSAVGAYIFGCEQFKLGDEVTLKIDLPSEHKTFKLDAKVVWLSDKDIQHNLHPGMGVEFVNLPYSVQEELIKFIEKNLSLT
ncbi:MAG: anti-sigma factor antagonist [Candidatus Omnitrophica bacterium]|nr:anti-sigma factor antagonist [Candidatus Omnitrophota bacterium]HOX54985.1 anti-sigma factor antagonist [Candidatus Omnitrophota bacterium]